MSILATLETYLEEVGLEDDITFWTKQFGYITLFYSIGLRNMQYNEKAHQLEIQLNSFLQLYKNQGVVQMKLLPEILVELKSFQDEIRQKLYSGENIGFIYPLQCDNYLRKLAYFYNIVINIKPSKNEELEFIRELFRDSTDFESKWLDPFEENTIKKLRKLNKKIELNPSDTNSMLQLVEQLNLIENELQTRQMSHQLLSIIDPRMLIFLRRENAYFRLRLIKL